MRRNVVIHSQLLPHDSMPWTLSSSTVTSPPFSTSRRFTTLLLRLDLVCSIRDHTGLLSSLAAPALALRRFVSNTFNIEVHRSLQILPLTHTLSRTSWSVVLQHPRRRSHARSEDYSSPPPLAPQESLCLPQHQHHRR